MTLEDRDPSPTDHGGQGSRSSASEAPRKHLALWQETVLLLGVALVLAIVVKTFFVQAFYIPSESMEPGLVENDRILVQKVSYWGDGEPRRGDVVVFEDPGGWLSGTATEPDGVLRRAMTKIGLYPSGGHLVKRVIGVGGDVIECCDDQGRLSVNGTPLAEDDYVKDDPGTRCNGPMIGSCDWKAGPVPEGHVFVMGDNRGFSADSTTKMCLPDETDCVPGREFVSTDLVVGKVFLVLWPWDHFRWVTRPDAFDDVGTAGP